MANIHRDSISSPECRVAQLPQFRIATLIFVIRGELQKVFFPHKCRGNVNLKGCVSEQWLAAPLFCGGSHTIPMPECITSTPIQNLKFRFVLESCISVIIYSQFIALERHSTTTQPNPRGTSTPQISVDVQFPPSAAGTQFPQFRTAALVYIVRGASQRCPSSL